MAHRFTLFFVLFTLSFSSLYSQRKDVFWSYQVFAGGTVFHGGIHEHDFIPVLRNKNELRFAAGTSVTRNFSRIVAFQGIFTAGTLSGTKRSDDIYFMTHFVEYGFNGLFSINELIFTEDKYRKKDFLDLYFILGWALIDFRAEVLKLSDNSFIKGVGYNQFGKYKKATTELVTPVGVGVKYKLSELTGQYTYFTSRSDLQAEFIVKYVNTDKLDANVNNPSGKDRYFYLNLGVSYHIPTRILKTGLSK